MPAIVANLPTKSPGIMASLVVVVYRTCLTLVEVTSDGIRTRNLPVPYSNVIDLAPLPAADHTGRPVVALLCSSNGDSVELSTCVVGRRRVHDGPYRVRDIDPSSRRLIATATGVICVGSRDIIHVTDTSRKVKVVVVDDDALFTPTCLSSSGRPDEFLVGCSDGSVYRLINTPHTFALHRLALHDRADPIDVIACVTPARLFLGSSSGSSLFAAANDAPGARVDVVRVLSPSALNGASASCTVDDALYVCTGQSIIRCLVTDLAVRVERDLRFQARRVVVVGSLVIASGSDGTQVYRWDAASSDLEPVDAAAIDPALVVVHADVVDDALLVVSEDDVRIVERGPPYRLRSSWAPDSFEIVQAANDGDVIVIATRHGIQVLALDRARMLVNVVASYDGLLATCLAMRSRSCTIVADAARLLLCEIVGDRLAIVGSVPVEFDVTSIVFMVGGGVLVGTDDGGLLVYDVADDDRLRLVQAFIVGGQGPVSICLCGDDTAIAWSDDPVAITNDNGAWSATRIHVDGVPRVIAPVDNTSRLLMQTTSSDGRLFVARLERAPSALQQVVTNLAEGSCPRSLVHLEQSDTIVIGNADASVHVYTRAPVALVGSSRFQHALVDLFPVRVGAVELLAILSRTDDAHLLSLHDVHRNGSMRLQASTIVGTGSMLAGQPVHDNLLAIASYDRLSIWQCTGSRIHRAGQCSWPSTQPASVSLSACWPWVLLCRHAGQPNLILSQVVVADDDSVGLQQVDALACDTIGTPLVIRWVTDRCLLISSAFSNRITQIGVDSGNLRVLTCWQEAFPVVAIGTGTFAVPKAEAVDPPARSIALVTQRGGVRLLPTSDPANTPIIV
ncbi:hypothetical protein PBRA_005832 [Plasmodiophora brassicae]|nr:hypothetical protein PBRA_005832 [Plasmodiophora brassicae]